MNYQNILGGRKIRYSNYPPRDRVKLQWLFWKSGLAALSCGFLSVVTFGIVRPGWDVDASAKILEHQVGVGKALRLQAKAKMIARKTNG